MTFTGTLVVAMCVTGVGLVAASLGHGLSVHEMHFHRRWTRPLKWSGVVLAAAGSLACASMGLHLIYRGIW